MIKEIRIGNARERKRIMDKGKGLAVPLRLHLKITDKEGDELLKEMRKLVGVYGASNILMALYGTCEGHAEVSGYKEYTNFAKKLEAILREFEEL